MSKVSIITRAFNRLEYTTECIDSIIKNTNYDDYEHIIINNNSTDGTTEWLNWIKNNNLEYFEKVNPINLETNVGDWGGMLESLKHISNDSEYIVQLDNDIVIEDKEWLNKCIHVLENTDSKIVQLKRIGVGNVIQPSGIQKLQYNDEELIYGRINRPVALFVLKTKDFISVKDRLPNNLSSGKTLLSNLLGNKTVKINNLKCFVIDGYVGVKPVLNYFKYPHRIVHNGK